MGAVSLTRQKSGRRSQPSRAKRPSVAKPVRAGRAWGCMRRGCGAIVADMGTVCLRCMTKDAAEEDLARRVHTVTPDQSATSGADAMRREYERRGRNRDKILKAIVKATAGTGAFRLVLADGLGPLLTRATADSPAFKRWLAGRGVWREAGTWMCSPSTGPTEPCSDTASG